MMIIISSYNTKHTTYAIFLKRRGLKDIKYDSCASSVHHPRFISASSVYHPHLNRASKVPHQCIKSASAVHHQCIISASAVHLPRITSVSSVDQQQITSASSAHHPVIQICPTYKFHFSTLPCPLYSLLSEHNLLWSSCPTIMPSIRSDSCHPLERVR